MRARDDEFKKKSVKLIHEKFYVKNSDFNQFSFVCLLISGDEEKRKIS